MANLASADCHAVLRSEPHADAPEALRTITVQVMHPRHGRVADLEAVRIDRRMIAPGDFRAIMDEASDDLLKLSLEVFDGAGRTKRQLIDHEHHRGSGCWGEELNDGIITCVLTVFVLPQFRHRGMGTMALRKLMASRYVRKNDFLMAWPAPVYVDSAEEQKAMRAIVVKFFRKNGFRRIGRTHFLGYSPDPAHPSRSLALENDPDAPEDAFAGLADTLDDDGDVSPPANGNVDILIYAIAATSALPPFFMPPGHIPARPPQPPIADTVNRVYAHDPASITRKDEAGWAPLHVATMARNIDAVRALLSLPEAAGVKAGLADRQNVKGMTPLEIVEDEMERTKAFEETMLGTWNGYDEDAVRSMYLLKKGAAADGQVWTAQEKEKAKTSAAGLQFDVDTMSEQQRENRWVDMNRYGCTCLRCEGGRLSPKMTMRLATIAEQIHATMGVALAHADPPFGPSFFLGTSGMDYIPPSARENVTRAWVKVYRALFLLIASMLRGQPLPDSAAPRTAPAVPTPTSILDYASRQSLRDPDLDADLKAALEREYIAHGGLIDYALDAVTDTARLSSPDGDSTFDDARLAGEEPEHAVWMSLPDCANDLKFDLVREHLGVGRGTVAKGPYRATTVPQGNGMDMSMDEWVDDVLNFRGPTLRGPAPANTFADMFRF